MNDKYCYPDTDILKNNLNITDKKFLRDYERDMTYFKSLQCVQNVSFVRYDFNCLKSIHKFLFEDIYPFAGKVRDVDISKGSLFCKSIYIEEQARFIFRKLEKDNYLMGLGQNEFINKLADYMADVNALHPFREGNGRTQRIFFYSLAKQAGYEIEFGKMDKERLLKADIEAMAGKTGKLKDLLNDHCKDLYFVLGQKIEAGQHTPQDIERFNQLQEQRLKQSVESAQQEAPALKKDNELSR